MDLAKHSPQTLRKTTRTIPVKSVSLIESVWLEAAIMEEFGKPFYTKLGVESINSKAFVVDVKESIESEELYISGRYSSIVDTVTLKEWLDIENTSQIDNKQPLVGVMVKALQDRGWVIPDYFCVVVSNRSIEDEEVVRALEDFLSSDLTKLVAPGSTRSLP